MLTKNGGGDHKRRFSWVHYICTMHCVQCTLEKQCTAHHVINECTSVNDHEIWFRNALGEPMDLLQWRHNGRNSVSNRQPHDFVLNRLFRRRSKKTSKLRVTGLCVVNSPGTGEFPEQMASNAENVSIWWRHHDINNSAWRTSLLIYRSTWH